MKRERRRCLLLFLSVIFNTIGFHTTKTALIGSTPQTVALIVLVSTLACSVLGMAGRWMTWEWTV